MCFQKEHDLERHYFSKVEEDLGFTHNVSTNNNDYYVSFNKDDKKFNGDFEANLKSFLLNSKLRVKVGANSNTK